MPDDLTWLSAWQLRELIGKGDVSPVEVVDHFLARIEEHDPTLRTMAFVDEAGTREQARRAEAAVRAGDDLGPLHGVPTAVKEHIAVGGMPLMPALYGPGMHTPPIANRDNLGIERLRASGAIIIGTNTMMGTGGGGRMKEPGVFEPFNWDAEARNPWDPGRVPGWSSSGGAASAAAGLLPFTIGSDGGGSTRLPGAYSGVIGLHPTVGLFPNIDYDLPRLPNDITIGPLARDVRDAAIVTQVMAGPDGRDPFCLPFDAPDVVTGVDAGVDGMQFAWTDDFGYASLYASSESRAVIDVVRDAAMGFRSIGAQVEATHEVWEDWAEGSAITGAAFNPPMPDLPRPTASQFQAGFERRGRNMARFTRLFGDVDLLLAPTAQRVAMTVDGWEAAWTTDGPTFPGGSFAATYTSHTAMFNWLRFPAVSVPCGFVDGLPVGLQIVGPPGSEARILQAAQAFVRAFPRDERPTVAA
ncbi:MAG TPA: amidase [Acidimicrobiia bacterium]|nr:amidase [Acidimicrobiia bacterium]